MEITTPRLVLREYTGEDEAAFVAYQSDPRAREFYDPGDGQADAGALVAIFARWAAEVPRQNWQLAIADRRVPARLVGSAGLRRAGAAPGEAELGLELAPAVWGQGYASEAARALLDFGFSALHLDAVRGTTISANTRVAQLLRRLGFRPVGERAGAAWLAERGWREVTWELRREEWRAAGGG